MRKLADVFSTLVIFLSIAILIVWFRRDQEQEYVGRAIVLDGDTILISNEKIRLEGIDAPEYQQMCTNKQASYDCGNTARDFLKKLVGKDQIRCTAWKRDKFERLLGICKSGDQVLNAAMVRNGWAVSFGAYQTEEGKAQRLGIGLWAGEFERPVEWRAKQKNH